MIFEDSSDETFFLSNPQKERWFVVVVMVLIKSLGRRKVQSHLKLGTSKQWNILKYKKEILLQIHIVGFLVNSYAFKQQFYS